LPDGMDCQVATHSHGFEGVMDDASYALSIKQPWAALLVFGHKTIEIRRWPTARRGRILIHASRQSDPRSAAWTLVPDDLQTAARLRGGIIGTAELADCLSYEGQAAFVADTKRHLNDPRWFRPPLMYGFVFAEAHPLPFCPCRGWFRFFQVSGNSGTGLDCVMNGQKEFF
jgi:hypothetical protein